jgi:hypothetical protein
MRRTCPTGGCCTMVKKKIIKEIVVAQFEALSPEFVFRD